MRSKAPRASKSCQKREPGAADTVWQSPWWKALTTAGKRDMLVAPGLPMVLLGHGLWVAFASLDGGAGVRGLERTRTYCTYLKCKEHASQPRKAHSGQSAPPCGTRLTENRNRPWKETLCLKSGEDRLAYTSGTCAHTE